MPRENPRGRCNFYVMPKTGLLLTTSQVVTSLSITLEDELRHDPCLCCCSRLALKNRLVEKTFQLITVS